MQKQYFKMKEAVIRLQCRLITTEKEAIYTLILEIESKERTVGKQDILTEARAGARMAVYEKWLFQ
jgi:hypothetical protein